MNSSMEVETMMLRTLPLLLALISALACQSAQSQPVTTPEAHLGRPVGVDFELADWNEISSYLHKLGNESPHAFTEKVGETTEGRDFLITVISNADNLANLDAIKSHAATLADPRGASDAELEDAIANGKVILFVSCQMHSTEAAGSQFGIEFAWKLATSDDEPWRAARDRMVTVLYITNPDGVDHVTEWYRKTVGTPHESSDLLKLYQLYSGHDNNRDWFMLTQNETRIVTDLLYSQWRPQVYWDVHQQGSSGERMFVPPFRDPLNPNLDSAIIAGIDTIGSRALLDMTRDGFTGISTGVSYDMWWNGGNRNVPVRHNIIGLLTEAASVRLATPIFLPIDELRSPRGLGGYHPSNQFPEPWPGGWWRLRDIIDYQMAFGRSLLGTLSREPALWLRNSMEAAKRTIKEGRERAPKAWIIPSDNRDPDAVRRLVEVMLRSGLEVHRAANAIEADGRTYPGGSLIVRRDQPYGSHAKDLFDVQRYPDGQPPYDVAGWTLSYLLGVRRVEVMQDFEMDAELIADADQALASFDNRDDERLSSRHSHVWTDILAGLARGESFTFHTSGDETGLFTTGIIEANAREQDHLDRDESSPAERDTQEDEDEDEDDDDDNENGKDDKRDEDRDQLIALTHLPRIGLYSPWFGSMDEGWMRYVLDTWDVPYVTVRNEMLRAGELGDFLDVLIIPSIGSRSLDEGRREGSIPDEYARGLAPEGAVAIEEFVRRGGTLIALDSASRWAIELFGFPLEDVTRNASDFSCPGSVLRAIPATDHALTADLPDSIGVFFSDSSAYRLKKDVKESEQSKSIGAIDTLLHYAPTRLLLSGWINNPETIENESAWLRAEYGKGAVHLFGFRPQYRGWSQATFPLIFRAALFDGQPPVAHD